ncbi:titin isoform X3 [Selaginella moellendorffii]|uniref:titin isoform X3 n=1 Tax=Selaginella moellendorffii TaxID=88036 RepID=UPI000D1CDD5C|nr:titin isoform X3 [Selaginella moellendorffii]|eukprot:XP_024517362.1 titin isoform X3 [Selaginella moellendorffii]
MSGFGRGGGKGGHGRGSGGAGGIAALRRGMPPKKSQHQQHQHQQLSKSAGAAPRNDSSSSASALEESFQLVCAPQGPSQFAMMIRLTPGLLDELRRAEAEGAASSIKFASHPSGGHLLKVGHEEYKFSSAPEPGELCDVFEEQKAGEDGQGVLAAVGSVWRKIAVQRTLSASEKDRVKKRSVEAEQQLKSRKAILVDSSLMKAETAAPGDAAARRPPIKGKKEPPPKKRKVTPAVPSKEKNGPLLIAEPAVPPAARSPPLAATASAPPHSLPSVEKRALVEEITIGSASPAKAVPKEKEKEKEKTSAATTPEVHVKTTSAGGAAGGAVNMTELRNTIIALLTETPRGMKAIEKSLSEVMPQPDRRNIEKILKSIALYKAPGKYELKPGVQPESYTGPSPGSGSLPDATAVDSPESPAGAAESKADEFAKLPAAGVEVERIDIGEEDESPAKSPVLLEHKTNAIQEKDEEEGEVQPGGTPGDDANITVEPLEEPNPPKAAASSGSSSTSGSDSDSDSGSDSSSGSGSSGSSGSESSSSSDEEDENVDIVSDDDNHKPKAKAEKRSHKSKPASARPGSERKTPDELHRDKDSEDIDIVDADDSSKLNSIVERITETIPLEVDIIPCDGDSPEEALEVKSDVPELPAPTQSQSRPREDEKREKPVEPPVSKALEQNSRERASSRAHTDKKVEAPVPHTRDTTFEAAEARSSGPEAYPRTSSGPEAHPKHSGPETHPRPSGPPAKVDGRSKVSVRKSKDQPRDNEPRKELDTGARVEADRNEPRKEFDTGARVEADRNELWKEFDTGARIEADRKEFDTGARIEADRKEFDTGARVEADRRHSDPVPGGTSKDTDFFAPYEKAVSEVRGPIRSHEQYMEYCREYREKYPVYIRLNSCLEGDRGSFERLQRDIDIAKSANDKTRLAAIYQKVKQDYMHCRKRFKRMSKTFLLLHDELRTLKDRCKEYARQAL